MGTCMLYGHVCRHVYKRRHEHGVKLNRYPKQNFVDAPTFDTVFYWCMEMGYGNDNASLKQLRRNKDWNACMYIST